MRTRPLILDGDAVRAIEDAKVYANRHRMTTAQLQMVLNGKAPAAGDEPNRVVVVPLGYRCVFTIEEQPGLGWCRHLSVSVEPRDPELPYPSFFAVETLMQAFGFTTRTIPRTAEGAAKSILYVHLDEPYKAVNVIEPMVQ